MASVTNASNSNPLELTKDIWSEGLSYLPFPECVASVSKKMRMFADDAIIYSTRISSFLNQIERKLAIADEGVRTRKARSVGIQLIQKYSYLLSDAEWEITGYNPKSYKTGPWNFDQMQSLIRNRRSQNLIQFFEIVGTVVPEAKKFADSLSIKPLSAYEKAIQIREWMGSHQALFSGIEEIDLGNLQMVPDEILLFPNIDLRELGRLFVDSCEKGNLELFESILQDPRFSEIPDEDLFSAYSAAEQRNDEVFLTALIRCPRAAVLSGLIGETLSLTESEPLIRAILNSRIFPQIEPMFIGDAAMQAAARGDQSTFNFLARSNQFARISTEQIGSILVNASTHNDLAIANQIMRDRRVDSISVDDLEEAVVNGLASLSRPMVRLLLTHANIEAISDEVLERARKYVSN